jgi:hypothetical protein
MSRRPLVLAAVSAAMLIAAAPALAGGGHPPKVSFAFAPLAPEGGEAIALTATATDEDHDLAAVMWDLDGDGTYETPGTTATVRLGSGKHTVAVRAVDAKGNVSAPSSRVITVANGAPSAASLSWSPATPRSGQRVTLTGGGDDPDGDALTYLWDLDGDGVYETQGAEPATTFMRGSRKVGLKVTDPSGASFTTQRTIDVGNAPPTGDFTWGPDTAPLSNTTVHLSAAGVADADDGADGVSAAWDLDDDGDFETPGDAVDTVFKHPGARTVALRLTDATGATDVVRHAIDVANRAPVAAFDVNPTAPRTGEDVTLTSRGTDPDGGTLQLTAAWDLDGDGEFDDATGDTASASFLAGPHVVRLRVTDGDGASTVSERTLDVTTPIKVLPAPASFAAPSVSATAPLTVRPRQMAPFPVVRLRGRIVRRGVLIELLSVKNVPAAARVSASCKGAGCRGLASALVRSRKHGGKVVKTLSHRVLAAGAVLELRITQPGAIGKLVRFTFRRNRPPLRYDGCLRPTGKPGPCA